MRKISILYNGFTSVTFKLSGKSPNVKEFLTLHSRTFTKWIKHILWKLAFIDVMNCLLSQVRWFVKYCGIKRKNNSFAFKYIWRTVAIVSIQIPRELKMPETVYAKLIHDGINHMMHKISIILYLPIKMLFSLFFQICVREYMTSTMLQLL